MEGIKLVHRNATINDFAPAALYGYEQAQQVQRFHAGFPQYGVTPLVQLTNLAKYFGIKDFYVKDESKRLGLNAFKALGGSYAIAREIGKRLGLKQEELTYAVLTSQEVRARLGQVTFVTATDGNHGRGVAWTAQQLGQKAVVFMPKGSEQARLQNIRALGAEAHITDVNYDDAVRLAQRVAADCGGIMVQDTSWEGYEEIPLHIMQGYTTLALEAVQQLGNVQPTHVFLQAGVGAMAGAVTGFLADYYKEQRPIITIVEPDKADCLYRTALADDGALHKVTGALDSIMAGLCCGEPCSLGWDMLVRYADNFISMPDAVAAYGMRVLGNPLAGDERVISGESGAAGAGLALAALQEAELKQALRLDADSVVLCISTEGDTAPERYRSIVWQGEYSCRF